MKLCITIVLLFSTVLGYSVPINVGVMGFAPPFSTSTDGGKSFYGFHIELMNELCKRSKLKCEYKATKLADQIKSLNQGTVDLIFSAIPIEKTNTGDYIYSLPYMNSNAQFVTLKNNDTINSLKDINNLTIGALTNTLYYTFINSKFNTKDVIKKFSTMGDMVSALVNKDVDVIIVNNNLARYLLLNDMNTFKLVGPPITLGNGYGILALKKNKKLINKMNSALLQMESDGSYLVIYNNYFSHEIK
ncbi:transporter substrate-binding domain-containing protein [Legionella bononiensis]|uniref:Transporter substrate-binding domain-containing protein n=1 Tax=Legionella bononiensis TaxID=2793102 RepID=A0ABS1W7S1_9GAMM|nr:transporter substrate-binding domain-containing protein [Legionella bononiensis]MBL7480077.1 transporter substrate-binding domain-containing protein [Legionella bononiensis]MBL7525408.1 transporter substrate-binding domain-containing protein [Legionella bononiensis]MBL7561592.1 transporter substrate-binding domain-containing protein [Legionella bononiensis]